MKLHVTFQEINSIIEKKLGQQVELGCVDDKTLRISKNDIPFIGGISLKVEFEKIDDNKVYFKLCDSTISWLVTKVFPHLAENPIIDMGDDTFIIHLDEIEQLKPALGKIDPKGIQFSPSEAEISFDLKQ